jgi:hypothetical protein
LAEATGQEDISEKYVKEIIEEIDNLVEENSKLKQNFVR